MNNNITKIKIIKDIYCAIYNQCEDGIYDEDDCSYDFYQKVISAASNLLNKSSLIIMDNPIKSDGLPSVDDITNIMKDIFVILSEVDFIKSKDDKLRLVFNKYNLNPDNYLVVPEFYDWFMFIVTFL